ncbi:MAG: helix-turn-helix domain-containing protein [Eubacteriales bacterium]|nr:helix-turn-helix domain-containing protein [Eubacteriales bacterium]
MNLLIVDDEVVTTEVLRDKLDRKTLQLDRIFVAHYVAMAKEILQKEIIDLVLCDIEMPRENGLQLLEWVRRQGMDTEFVFLTSHEKFEYAYGAVQNGAANYLLKPLDMHKINQSLYQVTEKICRDKKMENIREYWDYGKRKMIRSFWNQILAGGLGGESEIEEERNKLGLQTEIRDQYTFLLLHFQKEVMGQEGAERSLKEFVLENMLAEVLTEGIKMEQVVLWEEENAVYAAVMSEYEEEQVREGMMKLRSDLDNYFSGMLQVAYLSERMPLYELGGVRADILRYDRKHIYDEGEILVFSEINQQDREVKRILDYEFISRSLEAGERVRTLQYVQKILNTVKQRDHSLKAMQYFRQELLEIVTAFLCRNGMSMERIYKDPTYQQLEGAAFSSEFAMVQWNVWLLNRVFDMKPEEGGDKGIADRVVDYIHHHYAENINRNVLAEQLHFSPEYVGKAFRKEMGEGISDYINRFRIEKAGNLLLHTNAKVTDIALQVGYDNMPYFSSTFKKFQGSSPAEYRKIHREQK